MRSKRPRRSQIAAHRLERPSLSAPHQLWSMDYVADQLFDGRRFRALTVVDNYSRKCLAIHAGQSIIGADVTKIMQELSCRMGRTPEWIQIRSPRQVLPPLLSLTQLLPSSSRYTELTPLHSLPSGKSPLEPRAAIRFQLSICVTPEYKQRNTCDYQL